MTFEELYERLTLKRNSGVAYIIKEYMTMKTHKDDDIINRDYFIRGTLWGLYAGEIISDDEREDLEKILHGIMDDWVENGIEE